MGVTTIVFLMQMTILRLLRLQQMSLLRARERKIST